MLIKIQCNRYLLGFTRVSNYPILLGISLWNSIYLTIAEDYIIIEVTAIPIFN